MQALKSWKNGMQAGIHHHFLRYDIYPIKVFSFNIKTFYLTKWISVCIFFFKYDMMTISPKHLKKMTSDLWMNMQSAVFSLYLPTLFPLYPVREVRWQFWNQAVFILLVLPLFCFFLISFGNPSWKFYKTSWTLSCDVALFLHFFSSWHLLPNPRTFRTMEV